MEIDIQWFYISSDKLKWSWRVPEILRSAGEKNVTKIKNTTALSMKPEIGNRSICVLNTCALVGWWRACGTCQSNRVSYVTCTCHAGFSHKAKRQVKRTSLWWTQFKFGWFRYRPLCTEPKECLRPKQENTEAISSCARVFCPLH